MKTKVYRVQVGIVLVMASAMGAAWAVSPRGDGLQSLPEIPGSTRYLPGELIPQQVRSYAADQPVLENPWISVPRAAGFKTQDDYLLSVYPSLKNLPEAERAAALRGLKRTLPPVLEKSADGRLNPVYEEIKQALATANLSKITEGDFLAELVFHAQSPLRDAPPEVREKLLQQLVDLTFKSINPDAIEPLGAGNSAMGGEYNLGQILMPYLMLEIFRPEALTMDQRRTLNRVLMHPLFGFNGHLGIVGNTQEPISGILNKQAFIYNHLPVAASLMELQMARYPESENLWPGFSKDVPNLFRDLIAEGYRNYHNGLMGDGATRYVQNYTHAYFYEGPQTEQMIRNYLNSYDESDPAMMQANKVLADRVKAIGNYYEMTSFRVVENQDDSHNMSNRAPMSEAKHFGSELVNRPSDPVIHWGLANLTGNRWLRQSGPSLQAQRVFENPKIGLPPPGPEMALASVWNPMVKIGPDASTGPGFRQNFIFWDRNNLGATGKKDNWGFHLVGRGLVGRRANPGEEASPLFEKNTFAGFFARNAGSPPTETGLRTDHRSTHLFYMGIFPEKKKVWGSVIAKHPKLRGGTPGYAPHWEAARWSSTVTDGFAVQTSSARANATQAVCRELWLATPNGAVGLLDGAVSEDPENGDSCARLSFMLHGFFGTQIRSYKKQDGFFADPIPSPITYPTITPDGNGFDFVNLRVRVLEQNFKEGPLFADLNKPEDFLPTDKNSPEMRGLDVRELADNGSHGGVTREVQVRSRFTDGRKPQAVVAVHTGDEKNPPTARRIPELPGVEGEYLAMEAKDGDTGYVIIYNSSAGALDLSKWKVAGGDLKLLEGLNGQAKVRLYRSGARFRPDFLGNIEVNPETDKEDEIVFGSVIQDPKPQVLSEAIKTIIPSYGHVVLVTGDKAFQTGGPGFEVRPAMAEWRFRPENREGSATRELTGRGPALTGGEQTENDAVRVDAAGKLAGSALTMPEAGTIRFWVKPDALPKDAPALLFASGGAADWEIWADAKALVVRHSADGKNTTQRFAGGLADGVWQNVVVSYASADSATWTLRVSDALRAAEAGGQELPAPGKELRMGEGLAASFKDLAIHDAVLTPGELNFLHDREQPGNFNRIEVKGTVDTVWLNGNRIDEGYPPKPVLDSDKLTRHLKPGVNVIAIEMAGTPPKLKGRKEPAPMPSIGVWIRGRELTVPGSAFLGGWQTVLTPRDAVGSRLLAAYDAQIKRQLDHLAEKGRSAAEYRQPAWRPGAYDRPWLARMDALSWQPVTWSPSGENGEMSPELSPGEGLRLLRLTFTFDEQGNPQPFTP